MIEQLIYELLFASGFLFVTFCFVEYVLWLDDNDCTHENKTTYDSYHKQVFIDCGKEFSAVDESGDSYGAT